MRRAHLRKFLILQVDQLGRKILVRGVPERVDADGLNVDAHFVHDLNPCGSQSGVIVPAERNSGAETPLNFRALEKIRGFGHAHVAVNVHGFHAALPYHDGLVLCAASNLRGTSRGHRIADIAADKNDASGSAHNALYEIPAIRHYFSFGCQPACGYGFLRFSPLSSVLLTVEMFAWRAHYLCCDGRQLTHGGLKCR